MDILLRTGTFRARWLSESLQNLDIFTFNKVSYGWFPFPYTRLTEYWPIDFPLQGRHRYWNNDLILATLNERDALCYVAPTFGGSWRTSLLTRLRKYGRNKLWSCLTRSSVSVSYSFCNASRLFQFLGSKKFIRLNNSLMLLLRGVWTTMDFVWTTNRNHDLTPVMSIRWLLFSSVSFLNSKLVSHLTKIKMLGSIPTYESPLTSLAFINDKDLGKRINHRKLI